MRNQSNIEELKNRLPRLEVAVPRLFKKTATEMAGPCPKCSGTDRFVVYLESQRFFCRQCDWRGDIIDFHRWAEDLDIKGLALAYNPSSLPDKKGGNGSHPPSGMVIPDPAEVKKSSSPAGETAEPTKIPYYRRQWQLFKGVPPSERILAYLKERKIDGALPFLLKRDLIRFKPDFLILFPGRNASGNLVACQQKTILPAKNDEEKQKWMKGSAGNKPLYFLTGEQVVVITEAPIDSISVKLATEYASCSIFSASCTSYLIQEHVKEWTDVVLFFDNDDAGRKAAKKALEILPRARVVDWSLAPQEMKDANDLLKAGRGDLIRQMIDKAKAPEHSAEANSLPHEKATCDLKQLCRKILQDNEAAGEFDLNKLPPVLRDYVLSISATTAADPIMLLQSAICTVSAALKRRVFIGRDTYFQRLYTNLYTLGVANSGSFKTTALRKGARLAFELNKTIDEEIGTLKTDLTGLSGVKDSDGQKEVLKIRIENTEKRRPLMPSKMTPEALLELLGHGCGGMIAISELGEWLANLQKSHNADFKGLITDFYDCPPYYRYKTKNHGDFIIEYPFLTINALSTLRWLADYLDGGDVESGFFARFLIFCPPRKTVVPPALPWRDPDERLAAAYDAFKNAVNMVLNAVQEGDGREYILSPEAAELFTYIHTSFFFFLENNEQHQDDLLEPFVKRWGPYVLKLAIVMQIFLDPDTEVIGVEAVSAAEAVVEYAIKSTLHLFRKHFELPATAKREQRVLDYIAKQGGRVYRYKLQASRILDGGSQAYDEILTSLEDQGRIKIHGEYPTPKRVYQYELCEMS